MTSRKTIAYVLLFPLILFLSFNGTVISRTKNSDIEAGGAISVTGNKLYYHLPENELLIPAAEETESRRPSKDPHHFNRTKNNG